VTKGWPLTGRRPARAIELRVGNTADWWNLRKRASNKVVGADERVVRKDGQTGKRTLYDWWTLRKERSLR
jgi:hypothetical protein